MIEKHCLESFISDIDRIVAGESVILSECEHCDEDYKDIIRLAQLLEKADYATEPRGGLERICSNIPRIGELEDDDLDMVAGGLNLGAMVDEKDKKNGK